MSDDEKPFHNPFAALGPLREKLAEKAPSSGSFEVRSSKSEVRAPTEPKAPAGARGRAVVRLERAGRGGKDVTVIEHLELNATQRDVWLKALKATLGCGGVVEGDSLVLQGDHRKRLPAILQARGVKKVTVG